VIVKSDEKRVVVRDVFSSQKIELFRPTHDFYRGLIKKQIIHGFLFQKQGLGFLSQGFLIHPQWALRSIEKISKKVSFTLDQQLDVLFDFAKKHLLYSRNPNLDVKKIYT
jgi:hypothetical protein